MILEWLSPELMKGVVIGTIMHHVKQEANQSFQEAILNNFVFVFISSFRWPIK